MIVRRWLQGAILVMVACANIQAQEADFRIETDLLDAGKPKPIDQSVTLFADGVAYDYSRDFPKRVMIVDATNNRISLVDSERKVQTRINLQELSSGIASAKQKLMQTTGGPEQIEDAMTSDFDEQRSVVWTGQKLIRYEAKLQPVTDKQVAVQYATFADASAMVNAWQSKGKSPPPFARLRLNQAVVERDSIPSEIKRTVFLGQRQSTMVSRVHSTFSLSSEERKQIEQFNAMLLTYPTVSLAEYNSTTNAVNR